MNLLMNFETEQTTTEKVDNKKGRLKIFFGMCNGVGKTYATLKAAQKDKNSGIDIVIGCIKTDKSYETELLLENLEIINDSKSIDEIALDKIIKRKPQIVVIDELAHTNKSGTRHNKRYQDILELLDNGIDVYTTVNVQNIESRADTAAKITGVRVNETVPDSIIDRADEIEIIDLSPEDLLKRFNEGKVSTNGYSHTEIEKFYRKGNLTALREMALRLTVERVDHQLREYKQSKKIEETWKSGNRLMVAIGPSPYSAELIRWSRRLASTMEAHWIAISIETTKELSTEDKERLNNNIKIAQKLGAEIINTSGEDIVDTLLRVAKQQNVTQIVIGKTRNTFPFLRETRIVNRLLHESGDIDIYVVGGEQKETKERFSFFINNINVEPVDYLISSLVIFSVSTLCYFLQPIIGYQAVSLILLLTISLMPIFMGFGPVLLAAGLSALLWNFLFIPPRFTLYIAKLEDLLMFGAYFTIAITTGVLTTKIRSHEKMTRQREEKTLALYTLTKDLSVATSLEQVMELSIKNIKSFFEAEVALIPVDLNGNITNQTHHLSSFTINNKELEVVNWVFKNHQKAGKYTGTLSSAEAQYYPVSTARITTGVIGIKNKGDLRFNPEQETLLETFIYQIASAMERELLNEKAKESMILSESERLYKTLFNSISHELKTPIAAIMGATSGLLDEKTSEITEVRKELSNEIYIASERLNRLVGNLLDMSRLESGNLRLNLDWHDINDLISKVLAELRDKLKNHKIKLEIDQDLPLVKIDFILMEQALLNIIINAINYTPVGSTITIKTFKEKNKVVIEIADNGSGLPTDTIDKVFDKFYRVPGVSTGGTGLGLSIVKGFVEAHKGTVEVNNIESGGLKFTIKIENEEVVLI